MSESIKTQKDVQVPPNCGECTVNTDLLAVAGVALGRNCKGPRALQYGEIVTMLVAKGDGTLSTALTVSTGGETVCRNPMLKAAMREEQSTTSEST
jgi:hypothetical protein